MEPPTTPIQKVAAGTPGTPPRSPPMDETMLNEHGIHVYFDEKSLSSPLPCSVAAVRDILLDFDFTVSQLLGLRQNGQFSKRNVADILSTAHHLSERAEENILASIGRYRAWQQLAEDCTYERGGETTWENFFEHTILYKLVDDFKVKDGDTRRCVCISA